MVKTEWIYLVENVPRNRIVSKICLKNELRGFAQFYDFFDFFIRHKIPSPRDLIFVFFMSSLKGNYT